MDNTINSLVSQTVGGGGTSGASVTDKLAQQILASSDPSKWTGQGFGSTQANALDIAKILSGIGVTDLSQFGQVKGYQPVQEIAQKYNGSTVYTATDENGIPQYKYTLQQGNGEDAGAMTIVPPTAKVESVYGVPNNEGSFDVVNPSQIRTVNGQQVVDTGQTAFGNKATGVMTPNTYSERQTGNAFGGTFAGSGNTGYRVNFDANGNPQIYTTGASSNNAKDYLPLLAVAAPFALSALGGLGAAGAAGGAGAGTVAAGLGDLGAMGALGEGIGAGAGLGAGLETGASLGSLGALGEGVAGMGAGTGLTASGLGGLGGLGGAAGFDGALGSGLTAAGAGGLGGATGAAGLEGALGAGIGAGTLGLGATNAALGGAALGSTLGSLGTGVGAGALGSTLGGLSTGVGSALGAGAGSALGAGAGSALGTSLATGLGLNALGSVLGAAANQSGISNARDLINQYGTQAQGNLAKAYADAQAINAANKADLASNYAATQGKLGDIYNQQVGFQKPYQAVGQAGSQGLLDNQGYFTHQFDINDLNTNIAPNYAFMLGQGQMANQRAANAAGGSLGGNALQGLQRYTQDYAGNAYQNAFNNYNTQRNNIYNSLAGMAGIGQTSTGQLANLGNTYSSNLGGLSSNYGGNITTAAGQGINAANAYGLNTANLATGIGAALAGNATASGANTATALNNLGNTALLGSMIKAT